MSERKNPPIHGFPVVQFRWQTSWRLFQPPQGERRSTPACPGSFKGNFILVYVCASVISGRTAIKMMHTLMIASGKTYDFGDFLRCSSAHLRFSAACFAVDDQKAASFLTHSCTALTETHLLNISRVLLCLLMHNVDCVIIAQMFLSGLQSFCFSTTLNMF